MNGERAAQMLFLLLAVTLPLSALIARGLPRGRVLRMVVTWGLIFLVVALVAGALPLRAQAFTLHNIYYQSS